MSEKPEALRLAESLEQAIQLYSAALENSDNHMTLLAFAADKFRRLHAENERLREALGKSLTNEQIRQIAASIDRSMPLESAKILFARRIEAALRREET